MKHESQDLCILVTKFMCSHVSYYYFADIKALPSETHMNHIIYLDLKRKRERKDIKRTCEITLQLRKMYIYIVSKHSTFSYSFFYIGISRKYHIVSVSVM